MLPAWFDPTINLATLLTLTSILAGGWLYLRTRSDVTRRRHNENQLRLIEIENRLKNVEVSTTVHTESQKHFDKCVDDLKQEFARFQGAFEAFSEMFRQGTYYSR